MKILHIGKYYPPFMGGIENFMADLMKQQSTDGYTVSAIVHHHEKKQAFTTELDSNVHIYRVPCLGQLAYAPIAPLFAYHLKRVIKQERPDVLHIHMPNLSAFWCLLLPIVRKIPWVIHWHADVLGSVPDIKIKLLYPFYRIFEKLLLKKAQKVIATSPVYLDSSEPLSSYLNKTEVIPLGLYDVKREANINLPANGNLKLLMVGRLTYYKGHIALLNALSKLEQSNISINLTIVGSGELDEKIKQQVIELGLQDRVKLLGKLSDVGLAKELIKTDLFCLPSIERTEAFGVVLLEAARAGKASLVTDVEGSGMSWVVQDGKTGIVAKANSVDSLVEKLQWANSHREELVQYGKQARVRFEQEFKIEVVANRIYKLYQEVCAND